MTFLVEQWDPIVTLRKSIFTAANPFVKPIILKKKRGGGREEWRRKILKPNLWAIARTKQ